MDKEYKTFLSLQEQLSYYKNLQTFLEKEIANNKIIYPQISNLFCAFEKTPFKEMKVVIFGQDPYHTKGFADGLAFSTQSKTTPKSLQNIFKEIKSEYPQAQFNSNDLSPWAGQGVLLLNSCLSVEEGKQNSHSEIGWDIFVKNFIEYLNQEKEFLIFLLWGNKAKALRPFISPKFHVLESAHPSPLSASRGFFGNNHFKKANEIMSKNNLREIDWNL